MQALHFGHALLPDGWARDVRITLQDGRIASVETGAVARPGDERHDTALPGLCNGHSHGFQRAMAGRTERAGRSRDSFWTWRERLYALANRLGPEEFEAITAYAYAEMLESGFTRVGEFHYLHHAPDGARYGDVGELSARVAIAAVLAGIRLTLLPVFYAHGGFRAVPPRAEQRRFVNDREGFQRVVERARHALSQLPGAVLGIAPHSLRAVTPGELRDLLEDFRDGPVHLHVAEQAREVDECREALGRTPVHWLLDEFRVDPRWTLVHATHADDAELARIAAAGATAGLCPITEANLGDGIFRARAFLDRGGSFSIGTDSNVLIDSAGELRLLEYTQRLREQARNVLAGEDRSTGRALFEHAVRGGRRSLGDGARGLVEGEAADFFVPPRMPAIAAGPDPDVVLDAWIFGSRDPAVEATWCAGRKLVSQGRHVARPALQAAFERATASLADP
jgi:formiminoglutamate deiminase